MVVSDSIFVSCLCRRCHPRLHTCPKPQRLDEAVDSIYHATGVKIRTFSADVREFSKVDAWLVNNPMRCPGTLHFVEKNSTVTSYGIQTNSTSVFKRWKREDPTLKFQIPLQIAAEREFARSLLGGLVSNWVFAQVKERRGLHGKLNCI